jgi:hypothetical protein
MEVGIEEGQGSKLPDGYELTTSTNNCYEGSEGKTGP